MIWRVWYFEGSLLPCGSYSIITLAVLKHSLHMFIVLQTVIQIIQIIVQLNRAEKLSIQKSLQCSFCGDVKVLKKVWAEWDFSVKSRAQQSSSETDVTLQRVRKTPCWRATVSLSYSLMGLSVQLLSIRIISCEFRVDTPQKLFARRDISTREQRLRIRVFRQRKIVVK